ncbi:MAG: hypothetical protein KGY74_10970 [Candidatus Cloacimonetes bacterium]|nr:hypothetical protein [Candidatus Cloacimonadota bacterium]
MKKNLTISIFLIVLICLLGCRQEDQGIETFTEFPLTDTLEAIEPNVKAYFRGADLYVYDSLLILETMYADNKLHLYNKNTFEQLAISGVSGKGPGEIRNPFGTALDRQNGVIWYCDQGNRNIWKFEIEGILKDTAYRPKKSVKIPSGPKFISNHKYLRDGLFTYPDNERANYLKTFNTKGEIVDSIPNRTNIYPDLKPKEIMYTTWYLYTIHPSKERIFLAYHNADIIVCTDFEGNVLYVKQGPDMIQEKPKRMAAREEAKENKKSTYWGIRADDKYLYCLYSGRNSWRMENDKPTPQYSRKILIFTQEGDPVMKLRLEHPTPVLALDKENDRIITYPWSIGNVVYYNFDFDRLDEID